MKLSRAQLCLNCNEIHDAPCACPACGSKHMHPVAKWLRVVEQPLAQALGKHLAKLSSEQDVDELERLFRLDKPK